jgi:hypothetical protein
MAWDYTQTGDPGSVGVGRTWLHPTTGVLKVRNTANTAWTTIGNVDDPSFGSLLTSGGAVSANITGNTGWAASDAHNFPTTASINSVAIATINDVTSRISALESSIVPLISSAIATYAGSLTFSSKIAFASGMVTPAAWNTVNSFPFGPQTPGTKTDLRYSDGSQPQQSECKWVVSHSGDYAIPTGWDGNWKDYFIYFKDPTDTSSVNPCDVSSFIHYALTQATGAKLPLSFSYFIVAMRP